MYTNAIHALARSQHHWRRDRGGRYLGSEEDTGPIAALKLADEMIASGLKFQVRSIHWSPYDPVRAVNADP